MEIIRTNGRKAEDSHIADFVANMIGYRIVWANNPEVIRTITKENYDTIKFEIEDCFDDTGLEINPYILLAAWSYAVDLSYSSDEATIKYTAEQSAEMQRLIEQKQAEIEELVVQCNFKDFI